MKRTLQAAGTLLLAVCLLIGWGNSVHAQRPVDQDGPADARTVGQPVSSIAAGTARWFQFDYSFTPEQHPQPLVIVRLLKGLQNGLAFEIWSPERLDGNWLDNEPVGRGSPEIIAGCSRTLPDGSVVKCSTGDLLWVGGFGALGKYYIRIVNTSDSPVAPQVIVSGPGLGQCVNPSGSASPDPLEMQQSAEGFVEIQCEFPPETVTLVSSVSPASPTVTASTSPATSTPVMVAPPSPTSTPVASASSPTAAATPAATSSVAISTVPPTAIAASTAVPTATSTPTATTAAGSSTAVPTRAPTTAPTVSAPVSTSAPSATPLPSPTAAAISSPTATPTAIQSAAVTPSTTLLPSASASPSVALTVAPTATPVLTTAPTVVPTPTPSPVPTPTSVTAGQPASNQLTLDITIHTTGDLSVGGFDLKSLGLQPLPGQATGLAKQLDSAHLVVQGDVVTLDVHGTPLLKMQWSPSSRQVVTQLAARYGFAVSSQLLIRAEEWISSSNIDITARYSEEPSKPLNASLTKPLWIDIGPQGQVAIETAPLAVTLDSGFMQTVRQSGFKNILLCWNKGTLKAKADGTDLPVLTLDQKGFSVLSQALGLRIENNLDPLFNSKLGLDINLPGGTHQAGASCGN